MYVLLGFKNIYFSCTGLCSPRTTKTPEISFILFIQPTYIYQANTTCQVMFSGWGYSREQNIALGKKGTWKENDT